MNTTMTMTDYRRKLKIESCLLALGAAALATVQVLAYCRVIQPVSSEWFGEFWNGFMAGAAMGITILLLVGIVQNLLALRNETRLRKKLVPAP